MQTTPAVNQAELAQHAREILTAWVRRDKPRLLQELEKNLRCAEANSPDAERYELLSIIATRMSAGSALTASADNDPEVRVCVGLLTHFITDHQSCD
jgi:hypothetical protein